MMLKQHQKILIISNRSPEKTIVPVNDEYIGLDDEKELHLFDREGMDSIRIVTKKRTKKESGALAVIKRQQVVASFQAKYANDDQKIQINLIFPVTSSSQAHHFRKEILKKLVPEDPLFSNGVYSTPLPTKKNRTYSSHF